MRSYGGMIISSALILLLSGGRNEKRTFFCAEAAFTSSVGLSSSSSFLLKNSEINNGNPLPFISRSYNGIMTSTSERIDPLHAKKRRRPNTNTPPGQGGGSSKNNNNNNNDPKEDESRESSWIERTSPSGAGDDIISEYSIGIDGINFQIGPLAKRLYDALIMTAGKRSFPDTPPGQVPKELIPVYKTYAMDMAAKEATKVALDENGMDMLCERDGPNAESGLPGVWGVVESVKVLSPDQEIQKGGVFEAAVLASFDSLNDVAESEEWEPGMPFSFVARNVKADVKELDLKELLQSFDPDGNFDLDATLDSGDDDDDDDDDDDNDGEETKQKQPTYEKPEMDVVSLKTLAEECEARSNAAPLKAAVVGFAGGMDASYRIMPREKLLKNNRNEDGTENQQTSCWVMDALQLHGVLVVDVGEDTTDESTLANMWTATERFFSTVNDKEKQHNVPEMEVVEGAGSRHAAVGYASYDDDAMQFLETRVRRVDEAILPSVIEDVVGQDGKEAITGALRLMTDIGKDVMRVAVSEELSMDYDQDTPETSNTAIQMAEDLLDDGKESELDPTTVNMSPLRMCRYTDTEGQKSNDESKTTSATEIFGAHTDTSFLTSVPVAAVSGLEIFDETAKTYIRPELMARQHWENEQLQLGKDPSKNISDKSAKPWHSRYVVMVPGELLQLVTRGEIPAAVHRVVAATNGTSRLSAPALLRGRPFAKMDVAKYYATGGPSQDSDGGKLLNDANGLSMEDIHDTLQPGGY